MIIPKTKNKPHSLKSVKTEAAVIVILSEVECTVDSVGRLYTDLKFTNGSVDWAHLGCDIEIRE